MNAEAREETFRKALKLALGEAVQEEWEHMASLQTEHSVSFGCRSRMKQTLSGKSPKRGNQRLGRKIGIGILVALSVIAMLGMTIRPVREAVVHAFFTWYDTHIGVRYEIENEAEESLPTVIEEVVLPSWLPDGWTANIEMINQTMAIHVIINESEEQIHLLQHPININGDMDLFDDTEVTIEHILLDGKIEAQLFSYSGGNFILTWTDRYVFILSCISELVSVETLISIAESMKSTKEKR